MVHGSLIEALVALWSAKSKARREREAAAGPA
jgi:hypothetical protein